jgi:FSR family fosmidomycin resistance protein-like MFS transporter
VVVVLLAIELLDELVWGTRSAAWPLIRHDLSLTYAQVGLVLAIPGFVGSALDPVVGVLGDTPRRRVLLLLGGIGFAASAALSSVALGFWMLLVALVLGNPATGAFVSLAQATLMDLDPEQRERNMARWTLAGSFGYVGGPVLLAAALWFGLGWRGPLALLGVVAVPLTLAASRVPNVSSVDGRTARESFGHALAALRSRDVLRWLALLEASDLLLDVFLGFLALYFVDVARFDPRAAALGVAVWTGAGLLGDWLLLFVLRRFDGRRSLRATALAGLAVYPTFLIAGDGGAKLALVAALGLLNSGWYAIPKARLYEALPGRSGAAVAVGGLGGLVGASVPLVLGFVASGVGLAATMWILLLAPVALLTLTPRCR